MYQMVNSGQVAGPAEINPSRISNKIDIIFSAVYSMEDPKELNPNAKGDLSEASDHEINYQQPYAQTDEHQDDFKRVPSLHLKERYEIDDESDDYWDVYEEVNKPKEAQEKDA